MSPVARALLAVVDDDFSPDERRTFARIEEARAHLGRRTDTVTGWNQPEVVGEFSRRGSTRPPFGRLLYALARETGAQGCLEFGSCMGISGLYLLAGLGEHGGKLYTMEAVPAFSDIAQSMYRSLGFTNYEAHVGLFDSLLPDVLRKASPIGFAYIDGDHTLAPTLRYDALVREHASPSAVIVHDDIRHSVQMRQAWREIRARPCARSFDVYWVGVSELGDGEGPEMPAWVGFLGG